MERKASTWIFLPNDTLLPRTHVQLEREVHQSLWVLSSLGEALSYSGLHHSLITDGKNQLLNHVKTPLKGPALGVKVVIG